MSLILATNRLDENTTRQASEKPSNFKNFFRSPIEIEPNSEIAVQSVKIQRSGNVVIGEDDLFCHYFGTLPETINDTDSLTCLSRTIKPRPGSYSLSKYEETIQNSLNQQYDDPRLFGEYAVSAHTNASGEELGLEIRCVDKGGETAMDEMIDDSAITAVPTYNIANPDSYYSFDTITPSNAFTFTAGSGSATFTRNAPNGVSLSDSRGVGILSGVPFGLNEGEFIIETKNASAQPYAVGLTRPQIQVESYANSQLSASDNAQRYAGIRHLDRATNPRENNDVTVMDKDDNHFSVYGTHELYDYVFMQDDSDNITIAERVFDENDELCRLQELSYWDNAFTGNLSRKLTKVEFHASWDGVKFKGDGDQIELYFKRNGVDTFDRVIGVFNESPGTSFNPIGSTSYALYPQFNVQEGSVKITTYEGYNNFTYKYPTFTTGNGFTTYTAGDDCFSNEGFYYLDDEPWMKLKPNLASNSVDEVVFRCDSSDQKLVHSQVGSDYVYSGLNTAKGVNFVHLFTISRFTPPTFNDTLLDGQRFPNMGGRLGYLDRTFLISNANDGYAAGDDTLTITFTSTNPLNKTAVASFIRIPNLTHKSFNGGQSGLSKILYQVPQFANGGNQYGSLYFEPGEKTYVKLHNPSRMLLNMLQVQIVDSQERELESLTGDTQIVFHVRQARM